MSELPEPSTPEERPTGTWVPSHLDDLVPPLQAHAMREAARRLLQGADQLDGKSSRVTFLPPQSGLCGVCGQEISGPICPDCAPGARS